MVHKQKKPTILKNKFIAVAAFLIMPASFFAQTVEDDFEGNGTINAWFGDDCQIDDSFANPFAQAGNTSATVLKYGDVGGTYANVRFDVNSNFDLSANHTFTVKIYVPSSSLTGSQTNQLSLKLQDGTLGEPWSTQSEIIKPIVLDQWQTVSFNFLTDNFINLDGNSPAPTSRTDFNRVLLQVNGENNNDLVKAYIDDFSYDGTIAPPAPEVVYDQLVWADEFDVNGAVDDSKWFHQTQLPNGTGWYNNELQHYTNRIENSFVEDGFLTIMAKKETFTDQGQTKEYTSARLNSKFAFTYGRVEARAKLPFGLGTWPAIWTLGKNIQEPGGYWTNQFGTTGWPACGEIDIMEHWGYNQDFVQSALHTPSSSGATINHGGIMANDVSNTFHVYELVWTPEKMDFSIDGYVYYTYAPSPKNMDNWPYIADQYLLLNVAMQGEVVAGFTESPMVLDYIRVYQADTTLGVSSVDENQISLYPNPVSDYLNVNLPQAMKGAEICVFNLIGQQMIVETNQNNQQTLDVSSFDAGTYFIMAKLNGKSFTQKFVKL